ncbi:MAG: ATP-dependent helicase HrpB [Gammaproteobacteria bacterium]|nr:ATP-dependent helicase HrpB [Gammaproteobacteria bacterium]
MPEALPNLPVAECLPALRQALAAGGCAVLCAPPGAGKSTLLPLALLDEPWLAGRRMLMLEPRRLAARVVAARMAGLLGERIGRRVGYQVRFERRIGAQTRIEVLTEGLLTRRLQADAGLPGVGLLIFDEFHERSLHADLGLALALEVRQTLRPDLRLLVMSATLDAARVAVLLDGAAVIESRARSHAVEMHYRTFAGDSHGAAVAEGVRLALAETAGDVLAFLPGGREIRDTGRHLAARERGVRLHPLYGDLPAAAQDAALRPDVGGARKVILATNLAQTSLTVEGVTTVVDGGLVRLARFDLGAGADALLTRRVSRAAADQRAGRAGRLGPGSAYRLWSRDQHGQLAAHDEPEIQLADLSRFALELAAWGVTDPARMRLLDPPPAAAWAAARELLAALGALDRHGRIGVHGRALLRLPLPPRRAHMLLAARERGLGATGAQVAALLDEHGDPGDVDLAVLLARHRSGVAEPSAAARVRQAAAQLLRLLDLDGAAAAADPDTVGRIVALGYPERLARRRDGQRGVFLCADGGEASLAPETSLADAEWLAIAHWQPGSVRRIRLAARIDEATLREDHAGRIVSRERLDWDARAGAVVAERLLEFDAIVLARRPWPQPSAAQVCAALLRGLRARGAQALPWTAAARQWQARVASLRAWRPAEDWPDLGDAALLTRLEGWLAPGLDGVSRLDQLSRLDLPVLLAGLLTPSRRAALTRLAPPTLMVPSGYARPLNYSSDGAPPVLAVKLQELFGLTCTPTVNHGRNPVMLHLLSPAGRPIQVTQDLAGFWARTYPQVRKELKGRYPKHPWPDDPLSAPPSTRAKPRRQRCDR